MINRVSSEAFSFSYASVSVLRVNIASSPLGAAPETAPAAVTGSSSAGNPLTDSVSLSPAAQAASQSAPAAVGNEPPAPGSAAPTPVNPGPASIATDSQSRIAALITALDRDGDGALSEDEFVDGARRLLRGSRGRHGHHHHADKAEGPSRGDGSHGRARGLEKRLERAFGAIDADGDGALTQDELVAALDRAAASGPAQAAGGSQAATGSGSSVTGAAAANAPGGTPIALPPSPAQGETTAAGGTTVNGPATEAPAGNQSPKPEETPAKGTAEAAPAASTNGGMLVSFSFTRVTYVSVAIQRYQSVGQLAA